MVAGHPARDAAPPVRLDEIQGALLLHTGTGPAAALRAVTTALARAHPETIVVTSPAVTARADVFGLAAEALVRHPPARPAVRLVLLGDGPDRAARISGIREVAARLDRPVTGPLGRITVAADGTCVSLPPVDDPAAPAAEQTVPDEPAGSAGWHTRTGTGDGHDEPPWSPAPAWPPVSVRRPGPGVVLRPVPAGLWLLPPDLPAEFSGTVAGLPREPDAVTLFVGGCGRPVEVDALVAAVTALRPDPATRLVLLPGALPAGTGLAALSDLPVRLRCAVPARTGTGRRLAPVTPEGVVLPVDGTAVALEPAAVPVPATAPGTGRQPRDPATATGRATAAGWSFLPAGSTPFGFVAAIAGTVVEVASGRRGFVVDGAKVRADRLADLLLAAGVPARVPLLVVDPDTAVRPALLADLATAWGAPVHAPSGPAALTVTGVLLAAGGFTTYPPGGAARPAGPVLPAACAAALAALADPATPPPPARRARRRRAERRVNGHHLPAGGDIWVPEIPVTDPVRARDDDAPPPGDLAATVAQALGADQERVAEELRAQRPDGRTDGGSAGTVASVLTRMPLVFGPVFATGDRPEGSYRPGTDIVEPSFLTAWLSPDRPAPGGPTLVIWSASGRHLDAGFLDDGPACVFVPGSRFRVLDVDAGEPAVVYLADLATDRPFDIEDLLTRLRTVRTGRT
ncbi:hypothetical protein [Micromonospora radicis]|nr:hypothetical protein [Micromonospora radicis]